eukprot:COSAG05_NODE_9707_length_607_cov_0.874016_1_plen_160_part_10
MATGHVLLLLLSRLGGAVGAAEKDRITSLPGWAGPLPSQHFSGFVPLDGGRNVHYWFVESERDPATDPVVLSVQRGPGGSSLEGMFTVSPTPVYQTRDSLQRRRARLTPAVRLLPQEIGPFALNNDSMSNMSAGGIPQLFKNPHAWTSVASMIFWEAPAG